MQSDYKMKTSDKDVTHAQFYKTLLNQMISLSSKIPANNQYSESSLKLEAVRKKYLIISTYHNLIQLCLTSEPTNALPGLERTNRKALKHIKEALTLIELESYINPVDYSEKSLTNDPTEERNGNLFGLQRNSLKIKAKESIQKEHIRILNKEIQKNLTLHCNEIISFTFLESIYAVTNHITKLQADAHSQNVLVAKQRQYNSGLLKMVFQQLLEYGSVLQDFISKYRFSDHPFPRLSILMESLSSYLLKLRCLEKEVLTETYTKQSVPVLKKLHADLDQKLASIGQSLDQVEYQLSSYEGLDSSYNDLLQEYAILQRDIKLLNLMLELFVGRLKNVVN